MITYLDASALVKLYISEPGSEEVRRIVEEARGVGTATITRVEVTAALGPRRLSGEEIGRLRSAPINTSGAD